MAKESFTSLLNKNSDRIYMICNKQVIYKELCNLCSKGKKYEVVLTNNKYFWSLVIDSLTQNMVSELSLIFDEHNDTASIHKLINMFEQNALWSKNWCEANNTNHSKIVIRLKELYESCNDERKKLKTLRDKVLSHCDRNVLTGKFDIPNLTWGNIEDLITVAVEIVNILSVTTQESCYEYINHSAIDTAKLIKSAYRGRTINARNNNSPM